MSDEDLHYSSLLRGVGLRTEEVEEKHDPYWNIEVCTQCGGDGNVPSGVEYMGMREMVGCDGCYGIGYLNEEIQRLIDILTDGGL